MDASTGKNVISFRAGVTLKTPSIAKYIASVWGVPEETIPRKGLTMVPIIEAIDAGEIKGMLAISCNPMVSLPNNTYIREAYEKLEFFAQVDFFLSETARYADVVLAGSLMEEDEGTTTNVEGRVIHHKKAVDPPGDARVDWEIICDIASRLGAGDKFKFESPEEIFDELRVASKGGICDYYGITWDRIDREKGVFWPCPSPEHPGTPRLYEGNKFNHPDGKAHFQAVDWQPAAEETDDEYPIILTTGRVVSHYLSGTQTRRIGALVDQYPQPLCEMHPLLAGKLGINEGDFVKVESRRGSATVRANVVKTIRPDTVFVPYHWPLDRAANNMTVRAIDPISNIPEYKICAVRVSKVPAPHDAIRNWKWKPEECDERRGTMEFFIDHSRCIGCHACVQACDECDTHHGVSMIHLETIMRVDSVQTAPPICMHCEDADLRRGLPRGCDQEDGGWHRASSLKPALHRLRKLRARLPLRRAEVQAENKQMMKCDMCYDRTSIGKRPMCATVCPSGALTFTTRENIERTRQGMAIRDWQFGGETVRTKVNVLVPRSVQRIDVTIEQIGMTTTDEYDVAALLEGD